MQKTKSWSSLPGRISSWIHETIEDFFAMAPYHLKLYSRGLSSGSGAAASDFTRREMLIYQWIASDRVYLGKHHPECGRHWIMLGDLYASELWPAAGMTCYERGLRIYRLSLPEHDQRVIEVKGKIASCFKASGRLEEAQLLIGEIARARLEFDCSTDDRLEALSAWRAILAELEEHEKACDVQRRIVAILEADALPFANLKPVEKLVEPYRKLGRLLIGCGQADGQLFLDLGDGLETLPILCRACGFESATLRPDIEKIRSLYLRRGLIEVAAFFAEWLILIDLSRKVSGLEYAGIVTDLEKLAAYYEKRDEPGDRTVAHRYRRRAELIAYKEKS